MSGTFDRSLGVRHLVCGSCNGCEHEMNALTGPLYDITRDGWDVVASPRHADAISVTGPMTRAMRHAAERTIEAAAAPRIIVAVGDCAAGTGPWADAPQAGNGAGVELGAAVVVPGCPPSPDAIRAGLREAARLLGAADRVASGDQAARASEPPRVPEAETARSPAPAIRNGVERAAEPGRRAYW